VRKGKAAEAAGEEMILAEKIMTLRKKEGWSQEELAGKLNVSRQSVSKWESGASIPDIDKILMLSGLFGVSTDYLLKDAMESDVPQKDGPVCVDTGSRNVSVEEADSYMELTRRRAWRTAAATSLFVLSPVPLILLAGLAEYGRGITEDMAGGLGVMLLLVMVAAGVAVLILNGMRFEKYEYLEKELLNLQYGVQGIVAKRKEEFAASYSLALTAGTVLCILSVVPLLAAVFFSAGDLAYICCVAVLLALVAAAVYLFVWSGSIRGSFDKLLQEGDYTQEKKAEGKRSGFLAAGYWCLVTAVFLGIGFFCSWRSAGFLWPIAALLFVALRNILRAALWGGKKE